MHLVLIIYSFTTPSFTKKDCVKFTGVELVYIIDDMLRILLENITKREPASVM